MSRSDRRNSWRTSLLRISRTLSTRLSFGLLTGATFAFVLSLAILLSAACTAARAQNSTGSTTYSTTQRVFKVGILLIDSTDLKDGHGDENPDPYVFYVADKRTDLKPQGWQFINPLAPATVTATIKNRWDNRMGGNGASGYQIGQKVTPDMAAYWEVSLTSATLSELLQFDMLFITNHRATAFTPADREKMRKLVDAGGVIWMEDCGGMTLGSALVPNTNPQQTELGPFFLSDVQFEGGGFGDFVNNGPVVYQPTHPILNSPYQLALSEIANLGDKNYGNYHIATFSPSASATGQSGQGHTIEQLPNADTIVNVVGNFGAPKDPTTQQFLSYISVAHYGSGSVVLTAGDSGCDINDYIGGTSGGSGGNSGSISGSNFAAAHAEDLKFLYNIVSWGSSNTAYRRNDRRTASSFETLNAPLLPQFNFATLFRTSNPYTAGSDRMSSKSAALISNGILYVSGVDAGKLTLRAYDTQPFSDIDGDGNYDEGIPDISLGLPYDEIWRWEGGTAPSSGSDPFGNTLYEDPSSPVIATVPGANTVLGASVPGDEVFISGPDGALYIFDALPGLGAGSLSGTPKLLKTVGGEGGTYNATATHGVSPAPVVYGGMVFQVEPDGLVRCLSAEIATLGEVLWTSFASGAAPYSIVPTGTPTLGFSQLTGNSVLAKYAEGYANDLMLYVPVETTPQGASTGTPPTGQMLAYWIGTRNEVQHFLPNADGQGNGTSAIMEARVAGGGGATLAGALNVAPGPNDLAGSPFVQPVVRVYSKTYNSDGTITPTQSNYENGIVSSDYTGKFVQTGGVYTGQIEIDKVGSNNLALPPGLGQNQEPSIWASVDYDVLYISPLSNPAKPATYDSVSPIGARVDQNLTIQNYHSKIGQTGFGFPGGGLETPAFSPDDLLLFSADQSNAPTDPPLMTSIFAIHEQMNATQLFWRFGLHNQGAAAGTADGVSINDYDPIYNYNKFTFTADGTLLTTQLPTGNPEFISNVSTFGPPITTNSGLTYFLAGGLSYGASTGGTAPNPYGLNQGPVTVLMAFTTNPTITLTLPISFDANSAVQVSQVNSLDNTTTVTAGTSQLTVDAERGKIILKNFTGTGGQFSASQSFVVQVTPVGQTTPVRFVVHPQPAAAVPSTYSAGQINPDLGGFTPLQYYYVLPGTPMSPPTQIGDYIFFTMRIPVTGTGSFQTAIIAVDANPSGNDSSVRTGFGEPVNNVAYPAPVGGITHLHWIGRMTDDSGSTNVPVSAYAAPVGSEKTLAINSSIGTFAFQDAPTLIADGARLIEVGPDGTASYTLDTTQTRPVLGGDLPIYGPNGTLLNGASGNPTGRTAITSQALSHPSLVHKAGSSDYLIADTGNNRVIRADRSGTVSWQLSTITDPYKLLASGDQTTLNGPSDAQFYILPTTNGGYTVHYLVADPGNFRIIEVADYFDQHGNAVDAPGAAGTAGKHVLVWSTRTLSSQGQHLSFTNIQRYLGTDSSGQYANFPYIIATVSNSTVGGASVGGGTNSTGGALVSINYSPYATTLPVTQISNGTASGYTPWPLTGGAAVSTEPIGDGTVIASANDLRETNASQTTFGPSGSSVPTSGAAFTIRRLQHPTYFTEINLPNVATNPATIRTIYLICDAGTVYAVEATVDSTGTPVRNVLWKFTQDDYNAMNIDRLYNAGKSGTYTIPSGLDATLLPRFAPSSVKLLQNGDFLITNSYFGRCPLCKTGQFVGEVFQVAPTAVPGSASGTSVTRPSTPFSLFTQSSSTITAEGGIWDNFAAPMMYATGTGLFYQQMGLTGNTNLLEQPLFSDRP